MATLGAVDLQMLVEDWKVPTVPHCSNCAHCIVVGEPEEPMVDCSAGHGKPVTLWQMIRVQHPRAWRAAYQCPDWSSMSDDPKTKKPA